MQKHQAIGITGMGIVSPIGNNISSFGNSLKKGISGIKKVEKLSEPKLSVSIASKIESFSFIEQLNQLENIPEEKLKKAKQLGQRAPFVIQTSILSALQAWQQAGLFEKKINSERIGIVIGGQNSTQNYQYQLIPRFIDNPEYLTPRYALEFLETNQIGVLSELFGIEGEGVVVGGASATGNVCIIKAYQLVQLDIVDACLVVGVATDLSPVDIQGFINIGAMGGKTFGEEPEKACRPFDVAHEGFIYGQASASIIIETETSSRERKVPQLAEILGYGYNLDKNSLANPNVNGEIKAMQQALSRAGISISEINYINTHGSASPLGDDTEAEAIREVFKEDINHIWLNATKGLTGHCLFSAGMVETVATIVQMQEGFLHPNKNLETPICNQLQFCNSESKAFQIEAALTNSFGFGGINTSIALKRK